MSCFSRTLSKSNPAAIAEIRLGCLSSFCISWFPLAANSSEWVVRKETWSMLQGTPVLQSKHGQRAPMGNRALGHTANLTTERWGLQIFHSKSTLPHSQVNKNKYMHETILVKISALGRISSSLYWGMLKQWFHQHNFFSTLALSFPYLP